MASQAFTGVRAIFKINGKQVAFASNCSYTINHTLTPIEVLDRLNPIEYAETGYNVEFNCSTFRVAHKSAVDLGIQPVLEKILTQPELTVELQDRVTDATLLRVIGVKMSSRAGTIDARGVATETWNFVGLKASDEASA